MSLVNLLFGFNGRINRRQYWLGLAAAQIGAIALLLICGVLFFASIAASGEGAHVGHAIVGAFGGLALYGLLNFIATVASMALIAKRLHDLGQTGFWCMLLLLAPSPLATTSILNIMTLNTRIGGEAPSLLAPGYSLLAFAALTLAAITILGCIPGNAGPNKHGDPVGSGADGGFAPPAPQAPPANASASSSAMSSVFGAQSAMERAIAEHKAAPAMATAARPVVASPTGAAPSFGRRQAR